MKIALLDIRPDNRHHIYKDLAAGFGTKLIVGNSIPARFIEWAKRQFVSLPMTSYGYLSAILRQGGHEVVYLQNNLSAAAKCDVVLTHSSLVDFNHELDSLKQLRKYGNARLGIMGPVATLFPEKYETAADFVIIGEPEAVAQHIADSGAVLSGKVVSPGIKNLDDLPFPDWKGFPVQTYSYFPSLKRSPVLPVLGSRGCFAPCEYCAYRTNFKWRMRSPENVVDELEQIQHRYGLKAVLFRDPMFTGNNNRAQQIAELILKRGLDIHFACETALEFLNEKLIDLLYRAGLRSVNVGIESGNDQVLTDVQRRMTQQRDSEHLIAYCHKKGIRVSAFYCIGLPADTEETIRETIAYAKRLNTHVATFNIFTPYPGTPLYAKVKNEIFDHDWNHYTSFTPVHRHPLLTTQQLEKLREDAFVSFYFRPKYIFSFLRRMLI